jgi:hypothetical protein
MSQNLRGDYSDRKSTGKHSALSCVDVAVGVHCKLRGLLSHHFLSELFLECGESAVFRVPLGTELL